MVASWNFKMPVDIYFGAGQSTRLKDFFNEGTQVVLVTDVKLMEFNFFKKIKSAVKPVAVFSDIEPNPTVTSVDALAGILREVNADAVIAVGGGSVMDCAKAACCLAKTSESSIRAFHAGDRAFEGKRVSLVVVPTTAGSGSEVTPFAVLDDAEKGVKAPISSTFFYPAVAIIDPRLTCSLPKKITAEGGLDALSHAMEGFWSKNHQPVCDLMAKEAAKLIFKNLPQLYDNPVDIDARSAMSYAALLAGMAFQLPRTAMVHACSYPLSSRHRLSHGAACALTIEFAAKLNSSAMNGRMESFVEYCGFCSLEEMVEAIHGLKVGGGLPCTLKEAGIPLNAVGDLIKESFHPAINNNPAPVTRETLITMYKELAG